LARGPSRCSPTATKSPLQDCGGAVAATGEGSMSTGRNPGPEAAFVRPESRFHLRGIGSGLCFRRIVDGEPGLLHLKML
jgi:hypothetical protein